MRNLSKWALRHRAGLRRGRAIIEQQDRKPALSPGFVCIKYKQEREATRRKKQIRLGQLTVSNGLI